MFQYIKYFNIPCSFRYFIFKCQKQVENSKSLYRIKCEDYLIWSFLLYSKAFQLLHCVCAQMLEQNFNFTLGYAVYFEFQQTALLTKSKLKNSNTMSLVPSIELPLQFFFVQITILAVSL